MARQLSNIMLRFKRARLGYSPTIPGVIGGFHREGKNNSVNFYWTGSAESVDAYEALLRSQFRNLRRFEYLREKTQEFLESRGYDFSGKHPIHSGNFSETIDLLDATFDEWIYVYDPANGLSRRPFERMEDAAKRIIKSIPAKAVVKAIKSLDEKTVFNEVIKFQNITFTPEQFIKFLPASDKRAFRTTIRRMVQANVAIERGKELQRLAIARA